eukprot:TRINITY_DN6726_c0_g1_i2.p1 TRINITY_DN6726_c0_g1~~TRINITY_DN6726_c0_g1_i2.p1  ORF type:complete len:1859 (-),score=472.99 TRINITY_DN6726_c0_g1_i2:78-5654(-)
MSSHPAPSPLPLGEYSWPVGATTSDTVPIQQLVAEEEPLITNTLVSSTIDYLRLPISLDLLDSLNNLTKGKDSQVRHGALTMVRQRISALMQKHTERKIVDENSVHLAMYYYNEAATTHNKVVNWYGVILKIHQALLQLGVLSTLRSIAQLQALRKRRAATASPVIADAYLSPAGARRGSETGGAEDPLAYLSPSATNVPGYLSSIGRKRQTTPRPGPDGGMVSGGAAMGTFPLQEDPLAFISPSAVHTPAHLGSMPSYMSGARRRPQVPVPMPTDMAPVSAAPAPATPTPVATPVPTLPHSSSAPEDLRASSPVNVPSHLLSGKRRGPPPTQQDQDDYLKLPSFLDCVVYWSGSRGSTELFPVWKLRDSDTGSELPAVYIELELILLSLNTHGTFDHYCQSLVARSLHQSVLRLRQTMELERELAQARSNIPGDAPPSDNDPEMSALLDQLVERLRVDYFEKRAARLMTIYSDALAHAVNEEKVKGYIQRLIAKEDSVVLEAVVELEADIQALVPVRDRISLKRLERLLIPLMGHTNLIITEHCSRLLNVISDGNNWQIQEPFEPALASVGDPFKVSLQLSGVALEPSMIERMLLLVRGPPLALTNRISTLTRHPVAYDKETGMVTADLPSFHRAGYFDWRLVAIAEDGRFQPLSEMLPSLSLSSVQGRFIVHPRMTDEQIHEVFVDIEGVSLSTTLVGGRPTSLVNKGTFKTVIDALETYKSCGVTTLWLHGVLEREDTSISVASDRVMAKLSHGGPSDLLSLVDRAKQMGMKVIFGTGQRISVASTHRKYTGLLAQSVVSRQKHILAPHPDTEGPSSDDKTWDDSFLLNWRKQATWDNFISEMSYLARQYGLNGICVSNGHVLPNYLAKDEVELSRVDPDGHLHYDPAEILDGEVILHRGQAQRRLGFWALPQRRWPNPLFVKLTKELWGKFPDFMIISGSAWRKAREPDTVRCGMIPVDYSLHNALLPVIRDEQPVSVLYAALDTKSKRYPPNTPVVSPLCSHVLPYPVKMFDQAAWSAIDLVYFLDSVPMTFVGEFNGRVNPIFLGNSSTIADPTLRPDIKGHYQHRAFMRKTQKVLTTGSYLPLKAFHKFGQHERVFAFCRQLGSTVVVFAVNLNKTASTFYIDFSPLTAVFKDPSTIYQVINMWTENSGPGMPKDSGVTSASSAPQHLLTYDELIHGHHFTLVGPYETLFWRLQANTKPSVEDERALYVDSMQRLMRDLWTVEDHTYNHIYRLVASGLKTGPDFKASLATLLSELPLEAEPQLAQNLQQMYSHICGQDSAKELRAMSYLLMFAKGRGSTIDPQLRELCSRVIKANRVGPIVFVCPELGRWSTVGGLGVMVDDLTQDLAAIGCEVYVISPYYNRNRKGESGYLAHDGIRWVHNIHTWIGAERVEVGVHEGTVNGVHLMFLHHINYFPHVYPSGSPQYQLKVIVLMAKAALEACCHIKLIPAIVVTNDWFTALMAPYAKRSGAFGNTFNNTTFIHLIHNLGEGYQGWIYPEPRNDTMNEIHQLNNELLIDPTWDRTIVNPSRAALLVSDQWATVSISYKNDLMSSSTLAPLLRLASRPLAVSNGLKFQAKLNALAKVVPGGGGHPEAKRILQATFFGLEDPSIPVMSFVGRITVQKGVHLILDSVATLLETHGNKIQILVGGPADRTEAYAKTCAEKMEFLRSRYPRNFWADPNGFFTQGTLVNLGSDFGLMPSLFEPGGIVQHEFFAAGTPVVAFKTGGLKDTVHEYLAASGRGNGFAFEAHVQSDFVWAVNRAVTMYQSPEHYAKLRQNAFESVITTTAVAWSWYTEICRLRRRVCAQESEVAETITQTEKDMGLGDEDAERDEADGEVEALNSIKSGGQI